MNISFLKRAIAIVIANFYLFLGGWSWSVWVLDQPSAIAAPTQATVEWLAPETTQADYKKADRPIPLKFPDDLGAHPEYQTEWWYYTGNLETEEGREFGYQFTIFRRAIAPEDTTTQAISNSDWQSNQIYFSHFTLSDIEGNQFYPNEKFSRGNKALAGAESNPYQVWIQDWSMAQADKSVKLHAKADQVAINLDLEQSLAPILQGDNGYSIKGPEAGNASYYYSIVQQPTHGTVSVNGKTFQVTGTSWKDHEYSTSALSQGTAGWDWFSLQFKDKTALMVYILRREDGTPLEYSKGTFINKDGSTTRLSGKDWRLKVTDSWKSPNSKAIYPAGWALEIPKLDLELQGKPLINNQELNLSTTYWEGAVEFTGTKQSQPSTAKGYIEMTGYKEALTTMQ